MSCQGKADFCTSCPNSLYVYEGLCYQTCGEGLDITNGEIYSCDERSVFNTILSLQIDLKCGYVLIVVFVILTLIKVTCKRSMGLLVALVIMAANTETITVILAVIKIFLTEIDDQELTKIERTILLVSPAVLLALFLTFNICVTIRYLKAIRKPFEGEVVQKAGVVFEDWSGKIFTCSRITCLVTSFVLSFHNTAWLNISGQLPLSLKRRLFMHRFTLDYANISKSFIVLPKFGLQAFGIYFGVFAKLRHRETQMYILDMTFVSFAQTFILLLALNF